MDHQVVPGTGGEQGMKCDQGFGSEAQKVAWTRIAYYRGMDNGPGDNGWLGQMSAAIELAQSVSSSKPRLLIGAFAGD